MRAKMGMAIVASVGLSNLATAQDWSLVTDNDEGTIFLVMDGSVRIVNSYRRAWVMLDYNKNETAMRSAKMLWEVDCAGERNRVIAYYAYSGQMGAGESVGSSDQSGEWRYLAPGTSGDTVAKRICNAPVRSEK
jgi:hypothetical protein